jgi:hypothetical protein
MGLSMERFRYDRSSKWLLQHHGDHGDITNISQASLRRSGGPTVAARLT